ncbi:hypothetical protein [Sphingomonas rubra]|uniref:Uncharacterized protein n=1 Tax=Sphingomonas rubra TaxID=634430 RepID=A0A1I5UZN0_9SPHN|nr:hypothetical protein [Sphingomonas rubra]SFQ00537.1 hypothetical protein SAMN04488241_1214 [Sphingomonas rubra]
MADAPTLDTPLIKKVNISPIQQRIPAVNEDRTLSFALHGEINRIINSLANVTNYNAETIQLIIDTLARYNILVKRVADVEKAQQDALRAQALLNSYPDPTITMSAQTQTDGTATVTIIDHNRIYADNAKTTVPIIGGSISGLPLNSQFYVYYDDPSFAGGAVTYRYTTDNTVAAQVGIRHSLGGIATGGAQDTDPIDGGGVSPPGGSRVQPYKRELLNNQPEQ